MAASDELSLSSTPSPSSAEYRVLSAEQEHSALSTQHSALGTSAQPLLLMLLVAVLAFLLASSVARNSDLWMHLARGRLLAHGQYSLGTDAQLAPDLPTNHSWLYDFICYGLYSAFGRPGLVLGKALLVVALALLLLRLSRSGPAWWLPAFCTALALLAMSIRLLLQPATVSYFFLALATAIGYRLSAFGPKRSLKADSRWPIADWPLLVLFVVWVNMDSWFVVGLGTAALVWLGQLVDRVRPGDKRWLSLSLCLLVSWSILAAVCLLNPAHLHAFALPPELGLFGHTKASTAQHALGQVTSPFQSAFFANLGLTPAGFAYFLLLCLSLLSFLLTLPRWPWQRFLPWLGLALLSAYQVRTIPFFAVVAGPVLAWNVQDFLGWGFDTGRWQTAGWHRAIRAGHVLTVVLLLVLLVCAWPGWLQSPPFEPRRWAIETSPALERGAAAVRNWLREKKLDPEARGLHLSPETAYAFAWFCPEEKGVRDADLASAIRGDPETAAGWQRRMRAAGINHVIVYDTDRSRFLAVMGKLLEDPRQWPLLRMEGYLAVFGWRDPTRRNPQSEDSFEGLQLDLNRLNRLAFHPAEDKKAPGKPSDREPEARRWWEAFWKPVPPRPVDQEEATLHLRHADIFLRSAPWRHLTAWESYQLAALAGAAGGWTGPTSLIDAHLRLTLFRPLPLDQDYGYRALPLLDQMAHAFRQRFALERDDVPPALLYLAVRAARRALAVNPNDAQAWLVLGESYLRFLHNTRERVWGERMPELVQLRRSQASAALNQAVSLKPNFAQARLSLSRLYGEMGYLDLALEHLRAYVKLLQEAGPSPGVSAEQFREQAAAYQEELSQLTKEVEKRNDEFVVTSAGWKVGDRALKAFQVGLAGKARDLLLESDIAAFGPEGMKLELELLLRTGRVKNVRDWIAPEQKTALGTLSYHWLRAQALAALGDYAQAREECNELSGSLALATPGREAVSMREIMALMISQRVLNDSSRETSIADLLLKTGLRFQFRNHVAGLAQALGQEADLTVLRGLLALEEGDVDEAEVAFRVAVSVWKDAASAASGGGVDFNGRIIAQECLPWLE